MQDWANEGYFNSGVNGEDYDQVWQDFANGEASTSSRAPGWQLT